ncbi:MAG: hypothetical protein K9W44_09175 [Candidatus Lokiarchaeota archaeon]|nr:hypothetical protein [Candidatus Harpocratesius repetitus]
MNPKKSTSKKKTHTAKISKKISSSKSKANLPIPPAPKTESNSSNEQKIYSNLDFEKKAEITARNLLRLYQFLLMNKPLNETTLIHEIELDTPNEALREEIMQLKLEIESMKEENQALQQNALRTQVEAEEQIEAVIVQNNNLKNQIEEMEKQFKQKFEKQSIEYEKIIEQLRSKLEQVIAQNEKYSEIDKGIQQLQQEITNLFAQKEELLKENKNLNNTLKNKENQVIQLEELQKSMEKKIKELEKKIELQNMVIEGYKRKEK